jgi:phosphoserine phosphatase RsbU/P
MIHAMIPPRTSAYPPLAGAGESGNADADADGSPGSSRVEVFRGMHCLDISGSERVATIMELVAALSRAEDPREVLRIFSQGMVKLNGPRGYVSLSTRGLKPGQYRITRLLSNEGDESLDSFDPWSTQNEMPIHTGGFFGEIIRQAYPEVIHHFHLENDPVVGNKLAGYRSMMAVPIFDQGEPLNWAVFLLPEPEPFTISGLEESIVRSNLVGGTVRKVLMMQELRDAKRRIEREVEQIARIQRSLLPENMPTITGLKIAASYQTFATAGGDYYDFLPLRRIEVTGEPDPNGPWGIIIADASGHGPAAAVVMAMLHAILHAYPSIPDGPAEVLEHVNRHMSAKRIEGSFVTAFFAVYDPLSRVLTYARAGHNPPLLKNPGSGGKVTSLDAVGGIPLGILSDTSYENHTVTLESEQTLILYTDGITEASCPDGRMFGQEGLESVLTDCTGRPDCVISSVNTALTEHEGCIQPKDDQTLVAISVEA